MDIQGRKNLRPTDEKVKEVLAEENQKQRISRILQVRHQASELSAARRRAVEQAREDEVAKLRGELAEQWQQQHDHKLQLLQEKLDATVHSIGLAHRAALEQKAAAEAEATRKEILLQRAEDRGLKALRVERRSRELVQQQHGRQTRLRKQVKVVEQQRAERVAQLPTPPAFRPPPIREAAPEPSPVLVQEAGTLVTSQYRPSERLVTRHLPRAGEDEDARARAQAERCRLERLKNEGLEKEAERLKRAAERGRVAEERQKLIETRDRLARLMDRDALHAFYRGEDVSGYLHERLEWANRSLSPPCGSQPIVTISDQTDFSTYQREGPTGLRSSSDQIERREKVTSDGISGIESSTEISDIDGGIGISGTESASIMSRLMIGDGLIGVEGSTSSLSNAECASGISGADPSDSKSEHTSSREVHSDRGVSACEATSDTQASGSTDSDAARPSVHATPDLRATPHTTDSKDYVSSPCSPASDFDALAALRQAEDLMAKVRQMKQERFGLDLGLMQPTDSEASASTKYSQKKGSVSSGSCRPIDLTTSEDEFLVSEGSVILTSGPEMYYENQGNWLQRELPISLGSDLSTQQNREVDSRKQGIYETETSSFDEEIGVTIKFDEKFTDSEQRETDYLNVGRDKKLDESLSYIMEMKNSLGMVRKPVIEEIDSSSSLQIPDEVYRNLQLLKQNRRNIDNKLEAAIRGRGAEPLRRRRQRSRNEASHRIRLLKNPAAETPETSSENSVPETRSYAQRTGPPRLCPDDVDDCVQSSKVLEPQAPTGGIPRPSPSVDVSVSLSSSCVTAGTSSFYSVTTPVRMYREEVKQDGRGERPLRRRDKFELQKRIVLQNYINRLLDTRRSDVLSSSSVEGSGIDVSSVKVLAKLAGGKISVNSSSGATTSDKDYCSSSSSGTSYVVCDREVPISTMDRLTDEQELDRVPSRLSDIEEQSRPEVGVQVPSEKSSLSVKKDGRNMAVQVPSVEYSNSAASVSSHETSIPHSSRTPVTEFSSVELISVSQQPKFGTISQSTSAEVSAALVQSDKLIFSNSSVNLPSLPSTSTPTVGDNVPKVSGTVSSSVSPIVGDDAISTVDQVSSDQFRVGYSSDRPLNPQTGVDYQILKRNLQRVKSASEEAQRPQDISHEVVSAVAHSQDDVSFISDEAEMVSSSLMTSEVFSELSAEELKIRKDAVEKKKAIYMRLLELNEIKQQYMLLQQQGGENITTEEVGNLVSENLSSNGIVSHDASRRLGEYNSRQTEEENNREWIEHVPSDSRDMFRATASVPLGSPSLKDLQQHQDHPHHLQNQRYNSLIGDYSSLLQQKLASRTDPLTSQVQSHARVGKVISAQTASAVEGSSEEWTTTEESNILEKGGGTAQLEDAHASRISYSRSRTTSDRESAQNFTSVEFSEGLVSLAETRHSPLLPELTQTSAITTAEESLEEGLLSTVDKVLTRRSVANEKDEHFGSDTSLKNNDSSLANESFKKLLEIIDLRRVSGLRDLQLGNIRTETSVDRPFQASRSPSAGPFIEDGSTSSVRNTSDECPEHAYDADHSSKGTTSSTHSDDVNVVSEKLAEQLRLTGVLRDGSEASAVTASTTSGDTLLAGLGSNVPSGTIGSSSPSDLEEVFKKYGWARGMLNKMNRLDQGYSSSTSSNS